MQCNKAAGYARYQSRVGDSDTYTNLWKMLTSTSTKLAKQDFAIIPLDVQTPVSMPLAIDPNMVLMMDAKEGQPAYWQSGENGLEFVRWAAPVPTPDSRLQAAKDRLVVKVAQIKNCEERLACMEERLKQRTTEKTTLEKWLQAVEERHQRDVDTFHAEKSSLQSRIDAMQRQTTDASRSCGGQTARPRFGQLPRVAPQIC